MKRLVGRQPVLQFADQRLQIPANDGRQVAVHYRCRSPVEFAPFRRDAVRDGNRHTRQPLCQIGLDLQFVSRIAETEQQADGDGFVAAFACRIDEPVEIGCGKRRDDRPVGGDAFAHGERVFERRQRLRLVPADGEDLAAIVALNGVDVAEFLGRQKRHSGAATGQEGIQPNGGAMHEKVD